MTEPRTRNAAATRNAILEAARNQFLKDGYDNTGLRAIAAEAGIDAALISRYFGSKKQLFAEVLESTSEDPMRIFEGDKASCGQRVARALLDPPPNTTHRMLFLDLVTRSSSSPEASRLAHQHIEKQFVIPFARWLGGQKATDKAWLIGSILMGSVIMNSIHPAGCVACDKLARMLQSIIDDQG